MVYTPNASSTEGAYSATMTEHEQTCQWCGAGGGLDLADLDASVANPQVDVAHTISRCGRCGQLTAEARRGGRRYAYRALKHPRFLRSPVYVLVYDIACGWCGRSDQIEPTEINATVGNAVGQRTRYDIYACHACDRHTAVSYLGQVCAYPATQDDCHSSMYYLEIGMEEE